MTAREYKEWEAYERAAGSLDSSYEREMLCEIHELIQINNLLTGAAITKRGKKNPAGKFRKVLRPEELYNPPPDWGEDSEEDDEDDEERKRDPSGYDPANDPFAPPSST
ncbi:hypothetical protein [Streptomyces hydrogenans]|uniref:Uncharacterized protein n=1 Tax=Streptomyces hydrogenans TaxID=1873719 RepID=A0ABQ3PJV0_9ACTN|nr:hypothetical protein [Streptomyces hydrogenans]GHG09688.1 hypothetical protein GCM10018784_22840 [Streptomyces hydrogenans]GHI25264.1 hypothetical protein Shyd_66350 [Streptomyces hydrogenans]